MTMNDYFLAYRWDEIIRGPIEGAVEGFYSALYHAIDTWVPKIKDFTVSYPKWFDHGLVLLTRRKLVAHSRYKISGCPEDYYLFSGLRSRCKERSLELYASYLNKVQDSIPVDLKAFWNHFHYRKGGNSLPNCMSLNETRASEPESIAQLFASHFSSVFDPPVSCSPIYPAQDIVSLGLLSVSEDEVARGLAQLDVRKGMGPDGDPPIVLRQCASGPIPFLTSN